MMSAMKRALRSLHLSLPSGIYEEIQAESRKLGLPAAVVASQILGEGMRKRHHQKIREKIIEYARRRAGTPADLDTAFEAAGVESLARSEGKK
jgi:hypothetical protein